MKSASDEPDREFAQQAVAEARKSKFEDGRVHPYVGAVVVKNGEVIGRAHRGELAPGDPAEYTLLEQKLSAEVLVDATVYTTLEPCTRRNPPKLACVERLIERRVRRVVVGMHDPNPEIRGNGLLRLREARIAIDFFPTNLVDELEELNRDFIRSMRGSGTTPSSVDRKKSPAPIRRLDGWYVQVNHVYWNRNFHLQPSAVLSHLVEVIGGLSGVASRKKKTGVDLDQYLAKSLAWWLALCGKLGVRSVEDMLWDKFPGVCPYCQQSKCLGEECREMKKIRQGPDWDALETLGQKTERPSRLGAWQEMFTRIYPSHQVESAGATFWRLTEELGELAEAVRVFSAEPGYFLSEASDVFAWLMHVKNNLDSERDVPVRSRGPRLEESVWHLYPDSCSDCGQSVCACPPILASTIGRIAHEVPSGRGTFEKQGRFITPDRARKLFHDVVPE